MCLSTMRRKVWNPRHLAELPAKRRRSPAYERAYQARFYLLFGDDRKRAREWDLFLRFCEVGNLEIDPAGVEMLDPPWPDLRAHIFGNLHYFELSEIVQEDWLRAEAQREKKPFDDWRLPLTEVSPPLITIIQKKCKKSYAPQATPLSLLLYWERNAPGWNVIEPVVKEREPDIRAIFEKSAFDHLWLFMGYENRIPLQMSKTNVISHLG